MAADILMQGGLDALPASPVRIRSLRADGEVHFDEAAIGRIGGWLLNQDHIPKAVEILALNAEVFPKSPGGYICLGEAWEKDGDVRKSIENYPKSF